MNTAMNRLDKMKIAPKDDEKVAPQSVGSQGMFSTVKELPPDKIFFTKSAFKADTDSRKMNLGVGAYRTNDGKPYVLNIVKKVEADLLADENQGLLNKEYLPIGGDAEFVKLSQTLILGNDSPSMKNGTVAGVQSLSGTGALRLLFNFVKNNFPNSIVYKSNPTWGNHRKIIMKAGLEQRDYRYFDPKTRGLDFQGMCEDLSKAPRGSVILLHACAHNPTGVDPTKAQWNKIADICAANGLIPLFDCAYQGYATGSLVNDRYATCLFDQRGFEMLLSQSYSKNMGLYGERAGCATVVCKTPEARKAAQTQLCAVVRPMYSNPPKHGAYIAKRILGNPTYYAAWEEELAMMANRILAMRKQLRNEVEKMRTPGTWNHITDQIGMFTYTGLTKDQVMYMRKKYHIYFLESGRISVAGLSTSNINYFAKAMDDAVRNC